MILDQILASTRKRLDLQRQQVPPKEMARRAENRQRPLDFPFEKALSSPGISVIAECKKASPSAGVLHRDYPLVQMAKAYEAGGASAISVLTEPHHFLGSSVHLSIVSSVVSVPTLCKDFLIDPYMVDDAAQQGASAVLLIARILDDELLSALLERAQELGLSALVEVHHENDLERALRLGARILGVNNRDLSTFQVDLHRSLSLRKHVPKNRLFVSESGIRSREDVLRLEDAGVDAILVGQALVEAGDRSQMLRRLKGQVDS